MDQPGFQILRSHLLALLLVLVLWPHSQSFAQQQYGNPDGYFCSDSGKTRCTSYALYRAQQNYQDAESIATLLGANASRVAQLNKLKLNETLPLQQAVLVPLNCGCYTNSTSYANITHRIVDGDTYYDLNVNNFEYLSTSTAVINANPGVNYWNLSIGQYINFPVRCACPSKSQIAVGVKELVTYSILPGDSVSAIAASFNASQPDIISGNELVGANSQIQPYTTIVVPVNTSQPTYSRVVDLPSTPSPAPASSSSGHSSSHTGIYVGVAVGAVVGTILVMTALVVCCFVCLSKRRQRYAEMNDNLSPLVVAGVGGNLSKTTGSDVSNTKGTGDPLASMYDLVGSDRPTLFTYEELCDATNNFGDGSKLHGSVYRGILKGQVVAIKQMKGNVSQELRILGRVHHSNLVRLVGVCVKEAEHLYLIYEYAENGSLSDCLHTDYLSKNKLSTKSSSFLSWTVRVQVALDAASGLEYIHDYINPSCVHKDVKSSNILLDHAFRAKIANFAMAKSGGNDDVMTRHIAGTYGYMAPEYLNHGLVSIKGDVFSFGVVLLELLSGDEAISEGAEGEERCLYSAIGPILAATNPAENLKEWMDPVLGTHYPMVIALGIAKLAKTCLETDPVLRPSMKDVTYSLSKFLNESLEWETSSFYASTLAETPIEAR